MPTLVTLTYLTGLVGFAFPPLWLVTIICLVIWVKVGRVRHADVHRQAELARMKSFAQWSR